MRRISRQADVLPEMMQQIIKKRLREWVNGPEVLVEVGANASQRIWRGQSGLVGDAV